MRQVVLSCFAGILVGLVMIMLPLVIFQPNPLTPSILEQKGTVPLTNSATGNTSSSTKEFGDRLSASDSETPLQDHRFSVSNPIESFGLTSVSIFFALSVFIASRHVLLHGRT